MFSDTLDAVFRYLQSIHGIRVIRGWEFAYANLRICLLEVPKDFQRPFKTNEPRSPARLSPVRQQENGQADEPLRHDERIEGTGRTW